MSFNNCSSGGRNSAPDANVIKSEPDTDNGNDNGQNPNPEIDQRDEQMRIYGKASPLEVQNIYAKEKYSCIIDFNNLVRCWGTIDYLPGFRKTLATEIENLGQVKFLSLGIRHACAITLDDKVKCWGNNESGQLGNNEISAQNNSAKNGQISEVVAIDKAKSVAVGKDHTCAITIDDKVKCWGNNYSGQLGNGTRQNTNVPGFVANLESVTSMVAGEQHVCVINSQNIVKCWGRGDLIGSNSISALSLASEVVDLDFAKSIALGSEHSCAINQDNRIRCWGDNIFFQQGYNSVSNSLLPTKLSVINNFKTIASGEDSLCYMTNENLVKCLGRGYAGQLGDGNRSDSLVSPVDVKDLGPVKAITAGSYFYCAINKDDLVKCWGSNSGGELGDKTKNDAKVPVDVFALGRVKAISAGYNHVCAITENNHVKCWGSNSYGQLGDGSMKSSDQPVNTSGLDPVKSIFVKSSRTCVVTNRNKTKCWGNSFYDGLTKTNSIVRPREIILNEDEIFNSKDIFVTNKMIFILDFNGQVYYMGKPHNSYRAPAGVVTNIQFRGADLNSYY